MKRELRVIFFFLSGPSVLSSCVRKNLPSCSTTNFFSLSNNNSVLLRETLYLHKNHLKRVKNREHYSRQNYYVRREFSSYTFFFFFFFFFFLVVVVEIVLKVCRLSLSLRIFSIIKVVSSLVFIFFTSSREKIGGQEGPIYFKGHRKHEFYSTINAKYTHARINNNKKTSTCYP